MIERILEPEKIYLGSIGLERRNFCLGFIEKKSEVLRQIEREILKKIESRNEETSCRKGCSACCVAYIEANIQECEAIAFYLLNHPGILGSFLTRYKSWRQRMQKTNSSFFACDRILHDDPNRELNAEERVALIESLKHYQELNIPCSFLENGVCSIYEVRPYVCANHYVTTPEAWCRAEHWRNPSSPNRPKIYMTAIDDINSLSFYANLRKPVIGFMTTMVFRILIEGLEYISGLTGENLKPLE